MNSYQGLYNIPPSSALRQSLNDLLIRKPMPAEHAMTRGRIATYFHLKHGPGLRINICDTVRIRTIQQMADGTG